MPEFTMRPEHEIRDEASLRALFPALTPLAVQKCQNQLDHHTRAFIERAPFLCMGTQSAEGRADVSPRGDPAGFVEILDDRTLAIPDRPGNNRLDSLSNILTNPHVGLIFMIPGFEDTLRINGTARLSTDPDLLGRMIVNRKPPKLAIVVSIDEVFMHCAKAFRRSRLWDVESQQDRKSLPSLSKIILDQTNSAPDTDAEMDQIDADLEVEYKNSMY